MQRARCSKGAAGHRWPAAAAVHWWLVDVFVVAWREDDEPRRKKPKKDRHTVQEEEYQKLKKSIVPENTVENTVEQPSNVVYIDKVTIINDIKKWTILLINIKLKEQNIMVY